MVESNFQHLTESHLITLGYEIPHILQVLGITTILTSIVTILASIEQVNTPLDPTFELVFRDLKFLKILQRARHSQSVINHQFNYSSLSNCNV